MTQEWNGQKWQYCNLTKQRVFTRGEEPQEVIDVTYFGPAEPITVHLTTGNWSRALALLGDHGWELVGVTDAHVNDDGEALVARDMLFKRPFNGIAPDQPSLENLL